MHKEGGNSRPHRPAAVHTVSARKVETRLHPLYQILIEVRTSYSRTHHYMASEHHPEDNSLGGYYRHSFNDPRLLLHRYPKRPHNAGPSGPLSGSRNPTSWLMQENAQPLSSSLFLGKTVPTGQRTCLITPEGP
jgi:hypothetical protein